MESPSGCSPNRMRPAIGRPSTRPAGIRARAIDPVERIGGRLPHAQQRVVEARAEIHPGAKLAADRRLFQAGRSAAQDRSAAHVLRVQRRRVRHAPPRRPSRVSISPSASGAGRTERTISAEPSSSPGDSACSARAAIPDGRAASACRETRGSRHGPAASARGGVRVRPRKRCLARNGDVRVQGARHERQDTTNRGGRLGQNGESCYSGTRAPFDSGKTQPTWTRTEKAGIWKAGAPEAGRGGRGRRQPGAALFVPGRRR